MSEEPRLTAAEWHRQQAVDLFNFTWTLIEKPDRTPEDDDRMLNAAHASRYHWSVCGTLLNFLRSDWQLAHVYTILRRPEAALYHAQRCLDQCLAHHIRDFDRAYAYEAMARAQACAGQIFEAQKNYQRAEQTGTEIAREDDRQQFKRDLVAGPWFNLQL